MVLKEVLKPQDLMISFQKTFPKKRPENMQDSQGIWEK